MQDVSLYIASGVCSYILSIAIGYHIITYVYKDLYYVYMESVNHNLVIVTTILCLKTTSQEAYSYNFQIS